MPLQHAEVALGAGHHHHVDLLRADELFGGDEFEVQHLFILSPYPSGEGLGWGPRVQVSVRHAPPPAPPLKGRGGLLYASCAIFAALATTSSMPPTM
ncbi:hypothetical protein CA235_14285 [Sphingomonas sp. ABOLF]|nr:hypothetical protein CA235_14285 [Sphingomonas sp. ABOLF]